MKFIQNEISQKMQQLLKWDAKFRIWPHDMKQSNWLNADGCFLSFSRMRMLCGCVAGDHTTRPPALTNQLTGNWTQNLDSGTLAEMSSLESLDLSRNSIAELPNGTLSSLNRLKILQFGVNTLRKVKRPSRTDHQPMFCRVAFKPIITSLVIPFSAAIYPDHGVDNVCIRRSFDAVFSFQFVQPSKKKLLVSSENPWTL